MLSPIFCNAAQIDMFKQGNESYVMMTFCFQSPQFDKSFRPPIGILPVVTIIMPRKAYKDIITQFLGYMARQDEPNETTETV